MDEESVKGPEPHIKKVDSKLNFSSAAMLLTKVISHKNKALTRNQRAIIKQSAVYKNKMKELEEKSMKLAPECEGRIICIRTL